MIDIAETFRTERLCMRKPKLEDATAIFYEYATDTDVTQYLSWTPHENINETKLFLLDQLLRWDNGSGYSWMITNPVNDKLMGMIDLRVDGFRAECGYVLAKPHWGFGYMSEVLIATRNLAFNIPSIERFQIVCDVDNLASAKVMEKAGFKKEGILRRYFLHPNIDTLPRDCLCYSCIR